MNHASRHARPLVHLLFKAGLMFVGPMFVGPLSVGLMSAGPVSVGPTEVAAQEPVAVDDATGTGSSRAAAAGATAGAIVLGALGGSMNAGLCDQAVCDGAFTQGFVVGALLGAVTGGAIGALAGLLFERPPDPAPIDTGLGSRLRFGLDLNVPNPGGSADPGICGGPSPSSVARGRLGVAVRPATDLYVELSHLRFGEHECASPTGQGIDPPARESARANALLVGAARRLDARGHLVARAGAGVAGTSLDRVDPGAVRRGLPEHTTRRGLGLHLSGGLRGGWAVADGAFHLGFDFGVDWIARSPMGSVPLTWYGVTLWR